MRNGRTGALLGIGLRGAGLKLMMLPMYCWAMLGTSILVVLATPVLAGTLILLSLDIVAHTGFFNPAAGGNAVVYQHLFWFLISLSDCQN